MHCNSRFDPLERVFELSLSNYYYYYLLFAIIIQHLFSLNFFFSSSVNFSGRGKFYPFFVAYNSTVSGRCEKVCQVSSLLLYWLVEVSTLVVLTNSIIVELFFCFEILRTSALQRGGPASFKHAKIAVSCVNYSFKVGCSTVLWVYLISYPAVAIVYITVERNAQCGAFR